MTLSRKASWTNADGLVVGFGSRYPERYATAVANVDGSAVEITLDFNYKSGTPVTMDIPAGTYVERVLLFIGDHWDNGTALEIGDGTDPNGWFTTTLLAEATLDDADNQVFQADGVFSLKAADTAGIGKLYSTADTIDVLVTGTFTTGSARLVAYGQRQVISGAAPQ